MTSPEWHPDDERLLNRYLDSIGGDVTLDKHLANCVVCAVRFRTLEGTLEHAYEDVAAMSDALFTPERLEAQRRSILTRLGQRSQGRVIAFPERVMTSAPRTRLAVAAALIVMTTTGLLRILGGQQPMALPRPAAVVSRPALVPQPSARQEAVYLDIEMALARHGTAELQALEDLTPRATGLVPPR